MSQTSFSLPVQILKNQMKLLKSSFNHVLFSTLLAIQTLITTILSDKENYTF